ncbi:MAG: hypothetical protein V4671_27895 [Armatimonadota bacterium]
MSKILAYHKTVYIPQGWDDGLWQSAVRFWEGRGFRFEERRGETQWGKRGSLWGNLFLLDSRQLRSELSLSRINLTHVEFVLRALTSTGQTITAWNELYWQRELESLETWLLVGDTQEEEWQAFNRQCHKARWGLSPLLFPDPGSVPPGR